MRRIYLLLLTGILFAAIANAQIPVTVTGNTNTTPNLAATYPSLAAALTDLNLVTAMTGAVTLTLDAGASETAPATGLSIGSASLNAVLSATNTVTIIKAVGAATTLNAGVGTATPASAAPDGILKIVGADYITIDGLTFTDGNIANPATMEFGIALFKASLSDGAQNNTIQNCIITLNRANFASGTAPMVEGSVGILVINSTDIAATTVLTPTTAAGTNSNNKFYTNTIQNANYGIVLSGFAATTPFTAGDTGNDVGGASLPTGNTIINYGGGAGSTNPAAGVRANHQWSVNISYNGINNNNGSGVNHPSTLRGIYGQAGTSANATINNNTVTIQSGAATSACTGIDNVIGSTAASNTVTINNNNVNVAYTTATTGVLTAISNTSSAATVNINGNAITGVASTNLAGTGTHVMIETGSPTSVTTNNNTITNISRSGASGLWRGIKTTSPSSWVANGNTIDGMSWTAAASTGGFDGFYSFSSAVNVTITNNIVRNISLPTTGTFRGIVEFGTAGIKTIQNNQVYNASTTAGGAGGATFTGITGSTGTIDISNNQVYALNSTGTTGGTGGVITGITITGGTSASVYKNKVYNLSTTSTTATSGAVNGVLITGNTASTTYNNLVGDLRATASAAVDAIRGISSTSTSSSSSINVYHNTIYLNASSSGTNFGTSGIFHTTSATATTAALNLRNNIIVNTSTANGTGFTVAYRRSSTTLTNYASTSNNNLFYAGTAASPNFIFYDGTTGYQLAAYKALVTPRDASSATENPVFLSVTGANANFLHIDPTIATQAESGGGTGTGITDDYDGDVRNVTTPDIGADEFAGISADFIPPTITYTPLGNTCTTTGVTLTATITDASGVPTAGAGLPVLYWRINAGAYTAATASSLGGGQYQFSFGSGVVLNDVVSYYIVAQDNAGTPNVGAFPIAGAGGFTANPPAAATPPTTPGSFTIQGNLSGTYTVGGGGAYPTITAAIAAYNSSCLTGPVVFSLTDATYPTETYPILINPNSYASSTNTLTIKPAPGVTTTISSSQPSLYLFRVSGNYVIFDGSNTVSGTTRDMTISNTSATSPSAILYGSANPTPLVGGTIKNIIFINGSTGTSNVVVGSSTSTTGSAVAGYCNDFTFQNNSSRNTNFGLFIILTTAPGNGSGMLITGNDFTTGLANAGISVQGADGVTITGNTISGISQVDNEIDYGIRLRSGTINAVVSNNTISNLGYSGTTSTGNAYGIWVESANTVSNVNVSGNTISGFTSSGAATTVGTTGIYVSGATAGVTIRNNIIRNMKNTNTGGFGASGMQLSSTSITAGIVVQNNMISDIAGYGKATAGVADNGYGIVITAGAGYSLYYNSVHLNTDQTLAGGLPSALNITSGVSAAAAIDLRNNIFANSQTTGTERYAIYSGAPNTVYSAIDYNDYYTAGPNLGFLTSNRATLTDIQTGFGGNTNSDNVQPQFTSSTDLHLAPALNPGLDGQATPIGGITTDIDGNTRDVATPDPGADEFTPLVGVDMGATALVAPAASGCYTAAETVTVTIRNFSGSTIDFAVNNVTVTVTATGGYNSNVVLNSGTLASGATQNVSMPATINMTANGTYTFNASTSVTGDITPGNDAMSPVNRIALALGGTYTVGAGGNYTTLTAAVTDYNNASCFTGPVVFSLTDAAYSGSETFPIVVNANTFAGINTLTIKPANGVTAAITGTASSIIRLNGADYVIIDGSNNGSTSRDLTIENTSTASNSAVIWVSSLGTGAGAANNTIKNTNLKAGSNVTTTTFGIHAGGAAISTSGTGDDNDNLTIQNNSITKAYYGIYAQAAATGVNDNLVITGNSIGSNTAADYIRFRGLLVSQATGADISLNTVFNQIFATTNMRGMEFGAGFVNSSISKNTITEINYTSTSNSAGKGITLSSGIATANVTVSNNVISALKGHGSTTITNNSWAIMLLDGGGYNVFYNSINIPDNRSSTSSVDLHGGIYIASGVTALDIRNNSISVTGNPGNAGGRMYGIYSLAATPFTVSNYNDLYVSGTLHSVGFFGAANRNTLADWQTATTQDANSISADPLYNTATNLVPQIGSPVAGAGTPIAGITTDITGFTRNVATPSIGAYEQAADAVAPVITYTPLAFTCLTGNRNLNGVTITDASGVPTTGSLQPRIYYKKGIGGTWFSSQGTLGSGTGTNGTWNFTIVAADMGGLASADVVYYYVIAQDIAGTPNISSNPAAGLVATDVNTVTTPPTSPNTFAIANTIGGTYTVGAAGTYTTLAAAFNAYNTSCLSGPVVFNLVDAAYTNVSDTIKANPDASSTNTLTIKTTLPNTTITSSATTATAAIVLFGADYVTIDGSTGSTVNTVCPAVAASRDLTITTTNTSTTSAVVWLAANGSDAATNITVKNCNITGNSNTTTLFGIGSGGTAISNSSLGAGNNNNSFVNNNISKTQYGIYSQGASAANKNTGTVINQNLVNTASPDNVQFNAIWVGFDNGVQISGNNINNLTTTQDLAAIAAGASPVSYTTTTSTGNEVINAAITNNVIGSVVSTSATGFSGGGILVGPAASGTTLIANNMISGVNAPSTSGDLAAGIYVMGGAGSVTNIYYNTVSMTGARLSSATYSSYALAIGGSTPTVDVRNNILVNSQTTAGAGQSYAIGLAYTSTVGNYANLTSNNNDLFTSGTSAAFAKVGSLNQGTGTNQTTLAAWQTETGRDAGSKNIQPNFVSATNLHLLSPDATNDYLESAGAAVSVTNDIDCETRPGGGTATASDIGADEFTGTVPTCLSPTAVTVGSIDITTASVSFTCVSCTGSYIVEYGLPGFTPGTGATPGAGGTIATGAASPIGITGLLASTTYDVYVRQVCSGPAYSLNSIVAQFTTLCAAVNVPYTENFDGVTAPAIPTCVTVQNVNGGNTWRTVGTDFEVSSPNLMRLDYELDGVTPANDWFYTRGLNLTAGTSYRLTFQYRNSDDILLVEKLEVKYGTAPNATAMTAGTLFTNTNIDFNTWREGGVDFTPASTGVYYIGFHGFSDADKAFLAIDDVLVDLTPSCPSPIGVFVNGLASTSAVVNFTPAGTNYIIEYGPAGFTPGTGATAGAGGTAVAVTSGQVPYTITGLTSLVSYDVYVRQVCTGPVYGPNSTKVSFTTLLVNDNAPGAITLTVGAACTGEPYTNAGATQSSGEPYGSCSSTAGYATVWYKFVAPASGAVRISTATGSGTNTLTDSRVALFSATDVNNYSTFNIISCDDDNGTAPYGLMSILYATGLTGGNTYYVQVDAYNDPLDAGTFCLTVDELNASMLATTATCASGETPFGSVATYTGWASLVNANGNLIALVRNPAGGSVSSYTIAQNINGAAVRTDAVSGQRYLDRNFRINNSTATNVDVQFFFLNSELTALQAADAGTTLANMGVTRQTGSTCQPDFVAANGTNSYLSQTGNGTSADGLVKWIQVQTPAFSNFYLHTSKTPVTLKTFLQGPYNAGLLRHNDVTTQWVNVLNAGNFPAGALSQPYSSFGHTGTESVSAGFFTATGGTADIVDWVLLELRNAPPPAAPIATRAAFIREDGMIVDLDKVSSVSFRGVPNGSYYVTIRHRNHLGIRTAALQLLDGALGGNPAPGVYDFSTTLTQAYKDVTIATNEAMGLNGSVYLMWAGNANQDIYVRVTTSAIPVIPSDAATILTLLGGNSNATGTVYSAGDINMDGRTRVTTSAIPVIPSDISFILSTPLGGNNNATRREHK